jgi:hypothetical protein
MHSNWQTEFTLVARLVKGQDADGRALAQALFSRIGDWAEVNRQRLTNQRSAFRAAAYIERRRPFCLP